MIVCGVLKSFSTFILLCKMKLGGGSEKLNLIVGFSLALHKLCDDEYRKDSSNNILI